MKIFIGIAIVGLVGVGIFVLLSSEDESDLAAINTENQEVSKEGVDENKELTNVGTLEDIKSMGNVRCDYRSEYDDQGSMVWSEGVIYHSGDRVRIDSETGSNLDGVPGSQSMEIGMIIEGNISYIWSSMGAFKMDMEQVEEFENTMKEEYGSLYNEESSTPDSLLEQELTYDCRNWKVDEEKFTRPDTLEFVDFYEMMEATMSQLEQINGQFGEMEIPIAQ